MVNITILPINASDREWIAQVFQEHWGSDKVISRGVVHFPQNLPGFVALYKGEKVGLVTYNITGASCEIVTLDSTLPSSGVGTALIEAVWVRFYQKRGFVLVAVHRNALEQSRKLKPEISLIGNDGIPLRDEIELEITLDEKA